MADRKKRSYMPDDRKARLEVIEKALVLRRQKPPVHWKEIEKKTGYSHTVIARMFAVEGYDYDKLLRRRHGPSDWQKIHAEIQSSGMEVGDACKALGVSYGAYMSYLHRSGSDNGKAAIAQPLKREDRNEPSGIQPMGAGLISRLQKVEDRLTRMDGQLKQIARFLS